jgi:formamidopyrimidine-DNA glycosylase
MPELPEVETLRRELAKVIVGREINTAVTPWAFSDKLVGQKISAVKRRAKVLIIELESGTHILIHLKMTGQLIFEPPAGSRQPAIMGGHPETNPFKYTRATLTFADGAKLYFNDLRKFGWWKLLPAQEAAASLAHHGLEPLSRQFSPAAFRQILDRFPRRNLKSLLLDQTHIAGLGNIYVDEAGFGARVRPTRIVSTLSKKEGAALHRAIVEVLKKSIKYGGTSARNYRRSDGTKGGFVKFLNVYGRKGEKCKRCKSGVIKKIKFAGRGTHFCPQCQA